MYIYIMRHGETQWNKDGLIQGSSDIPLTDYGVKLAEITAEGFARDGIRFDRIYTSPLIRAVRTAEIIASKDLAPGTCGKNDPGTGGDDGAAAESGMYIDDRLREMCFGHYEGTKLKELRQRDENIDNCFRIPSLYVPDETGESYEQVFNRIDDFIDHELLPLEGDPDLNNVLVICHGTVIRAFLRRFDGVALDDFWKMKQPNCSVNKIELKDGVFTTLQERILYYESDDLANRGIL